LPQKRNKKTHAKTQRKDTTCVSMKLALVSRLRVIGILCVFAPMRDNLFVTSALLKECRVREAWWPAQVRDCSRCDSAVRSCVSLSRPCRMAYNRVMKKFLKAFLPERDIWIITLFLLGVVGSLALFPEIRAWILYGKTEIASPWGMLAFACLPWIGAFVGMRIARYRATQRPRVESPALNQHSAPLPAARHSRVMTQHESSPAKWLLIIFVSVALMVAGEPFLRPADPYLMDAMPYVRNAMLFAFGGIVLLTAIASPVLGALFIWSVVRQINRRDDPRLARGPPDRP
jgi:hypothetical protein